MLDKLFGQIEKLITEHGSAAILKERIAALREEMGRLVQDNEQLRDELDAATSECAKLKKEIERVSIPADFVEHRGVLFRRLENGGIENEVYCPNCKIPMSSNLGLSNYRCWDCKRVGSFPGSQLEKVMEELA